MPEETFDLAIVGCGTMGAAILAGILRAGLLPPHRIIATTRRVDAAPELHRRLGVRVTVDNAEAIDLSNTVLVALKPQRLESVLASPAISAAVAHKLIISIAAGIDTAQLERWLPEAAVVRAMPNTPCLIGEGMTALCKGGCATDEHLARARTIFDSVGSCVELEEKHMDAVTALNGSGPAFCYVMLESMADGGVMMGLPRDIALQMAARVFQGAARMVLHTGFHPAALKDQVTTPAGCTIAGLLTMEDGRIRSVLARTIQEAARVASGLGDSK